jgi:hypothetical protein
MKNIQPETPPLRLQLSPEKRVELLTQLTCAVITSKGWAEHIPDIVHVAEVLLKEIQETATDPYLWEEAL